MKIKIYTFISILIMIAIFIFSSQGADISYKISGNVTEKVQTVIENKPAIINFSGNIIKNLEFKVRKSAHFILYFTLCFFLSADFFEMKFSYKKTILFSVALCFIYACTDEYHQTFIPGRIGRFKDVMLDTCGAFLGCITYFGLNFLFVSIINKFKK